MDTVQRDRQPALGRDDLVPLAIQFRVDHRGFCWIDAVDDRHDAANARDHCAKANKIGGALITKSICETKCVNQRTQLNKLSALAVMSNV